MVVLLTEIVSLTPFLSTVQYATLLSFFPLSPILQLPTLLFVVMLCNFVGSWPESHARVLQGSGESVMEIERELEREEANKRGCVARRSR